MNYKYTEDQVRAFWQITRIGASLDISRSATSALFSILEYGARDDEVLDAAAAILDLIQKASDAVDESALELSRYISSEDFEESNSAYDSASLISTPQIRKTPAQTGEQSIATPSGDDHDRTP